MLVGHIAVGLAAKRIEPGVSLGTLVLAALLADILWGLFLLAGLEQVAFTSGRGAANYYIATNVAWSHSLATNLVWAALFASAWRIRHSARGGWILAAAVFSPWVLDVISHRPDMPLAPGLDVRLGLGLWTSVPATIVIEGGFRLTTLLLYARATGARHRIGSIAFLGLPPLLTLVWFNNIAGPPPADPKTAPLEAWSSSRSLLRGRTEWSDCARRELSLISAARAAWDPGRVEAPRADRRRRRRSSNPSESAAAGSPR